MNFAVHTPAPLMPLTTMVGDTAHVAVDSNYAGRVCCFYGWGEAMADAVACKPHHVVSSENGHEILSLAMTLMSLGYEVVVTQAVDPADPDGDHAEVEGAPFRYYDAHIH